MTIKIVPNDKGNPPGRLADAELHFGEGPLAGLKLIGFAIWERRSGVGRNVTFPARQYAVNGERRSFALLRPIVDVAAQEKVRDLTILALVRFSVAAREPARALETAWSAYRKTSGLDPYSHAAASEPPRLPGCAHAGEL